MFTRPSLQIVSKGLFSNNIWAKGLYAFNFLINQVFLYILSMEISLYARLIFYHYQMLVQTLLWVYKLNSTKRSLLTMFAFKQLFYILPQKVLKNFFNFKIFYFKNVRWSQNSSSYTHLTCFDKHNTCLLCCRYKYNNFSSF